jgi:hypothetical protein
MPKEYWINSKYNLLSPVALGSSYGGFPQIASNQ